MPKGKLRMRTSFCSASNRQSALAFRLTTLFLGLALSMAPLTSPAKESVCYGSTLKGRLKNGVKLPEQGDNFVSYGRLPELAGRTYVHSRVRDIVVQAYYHLSKSHPNTVFKYAETGFKNGGPFKPHKTHQNGLSIDFMVPVVNAQGQSTLFPTTPFNRYGYDVEFNRKGQFQGYRIDFEALGAHIVALHQAARNQGMDLWRVLFAPELQEFIYKTQHGNYIRKHVLIPKKKSWVRHDEHYHVDFKLPCKPL